MAMMMMMKRTAQERGWLIAQMVCFLEEIANDATVAQDYRDEALRFVVEADEVWTK